MVVKQIPYIVVVVQICEMLLTIKNRPNRNEKRIMFYNWVIEEGVCRRRWSSSHCIDLLRYPSPRAIVERIEETYHRDAGSSFRRWTGRLAQIAKMLLIQEGPNRRAKR